MPSAPTCGLIICLFVYEEARSSLRLILFFVSLLPPKKVYALTCVRVPFCTGWQKYRWESGKLQACKYGIIFRCNYRQAEVM